MNPINIVDDRIVPDPTKLIDQKTTQRLSAYILRENDIVVGRRGEIGRCAVVGAAEDGWVCGTGSFFIRPLHSLESRFLAHLIRSDNYREKLEQSSSGTTMKNLSNTSLGDLLISVPPLPEQQRIVAILDEAFEGLATAKANAEKNLQNARALFESHLHAVFTERGDGWVEKTLGDVCQIKTGKKDVNQGNPQGPFPFFTCAAKHTHSDTYSFDTEALLVAGNGNVGQVSYYIGKFEAYQRTYVLSDFRGVQARYLFRVLDKRLSATVSKQKLGNTMPYIKIGMLTDFVVPVPPAKVQPRITTELDAFADETARLASVYERKIAALDELKRALLHQAFTGRL